jgi:divalent metal cation (Fe/Co/Zn/Cd) transporter
MGVVLTNLAHVQWADGVASIAIGLLLMAVSMVLANETRSLIAGEAVAPPILEELKRVIAADPRMPRVDEVATLHLGPKVIMVALTVRFDSQAKLADFGTCVGDVSQALKAQDERVSYVYVRPAPARPEAASGISASAETADAARP